ncbi:MAG: protease modulator HflC [Clostridiales bacterium]|nr:protease modulator HflC [Clostridiales bacterium]
MTAVKNKKTAILIAAAVIAVIALAVLLSSFYVVAENEYACVVRFSKIIDTSADAGLHLKVPFVDEIKKFPKTIMFYDIPPSEALTADQKNMTVDMYVLWAIQDPLTFYKTIGTLGDAEMRLNAVTYNSLKNLMGTLYQNDIINMDDGAERNHIYQSISDNVKKVSKTYGIDVIDVKIKRFDLPGDNEQAVYSRMISDRNQIAEKYRADGDYAASLIINDTDKQVNITISNAEAEAAKIEAEGEAEYMRMLAEAYDTDDKKDFYEFQLALEALKASLKGDNKTVILDSDSALGKALLEP